MSHRNLNPTTPSPWNLLAIDTSTHLLSVGVVRGQLHDTAHQRDGEGGAQASATLIPTVMSLLTQAGLTLADLDAIVFGRGPGAFTGLRTATAVVQGLAYGTRTQRHPDGLPVLGIDTLMAVAENARHTLHGSGRITTVPCAITALLDARMGELYAATYLFKDPALPSAQLLAGPWLLKPDALVAQLPSVALTGWLAGNALEAYGAALFGDMPPRHFTCWPTAAALLRLAPSLLATGQATAPVGAQPVYVRDQVAKTSLERAAEHAAALAASAPAAA